MTPAASPASAPSATPDVILAAPPRHSRALRRFRRNRLAMLGLAIFAVLAGACLVGTPWALSRVAATPEDRAQGRLQPRFDAQRAGPSLAPPTWQHPLGTDQLGRSLLPRTLYGGAISLAIGLAAALISVTIGVAWGAVAGYLGGRTDAILMRTVDVLYGLPYVLLVILMKVALEGRLVSLGDWHWHSLWGFLPFLQPEPLGSSRPPWLTREAANVAILFLAIGSVSWLTMARVVRGQVLSLKAQPFVEAARASGASAGRILRRHILPNLAGPVLVYATLTVPQAILQESFLSFLGIGIAAPTPTWGAMAAEGVFALNTIRVYWWLVLWPCVALGLTLLSLNFIGDGLRDALDPTGKTT